jgi:transposase
MAVTIGIDPHKASHTAVALDGDEAEVARLKVRASAGQVAELLAWAAPFPDRRWAVESADGWGYLVSQQLLAAGEDVLDVPATLAARVRLLGSGRSNKNDPNDARSVAIAAMRNPHVARVNRTEHQEVLRLLAKRFDDLSRARNRTACRLHALLAELVPGGMPSPLRTSRAAEMLEGIAPADPLGATRRDVAAEHLDDLVRLDTQLKACRKRITAAVAASGTKLTDTFGVGVVVAAIVIGQSGDMARFRTRDAYAAYNGTAPIELSSGGRVVHRLSLRGNRALNHAIHVVAISQLGHAHSPGRGYYDRKRAEGKTSREATRALKRRISDVLYRQLVTETHQA